MPASPPATSAAPAAAALAPYVLLLAAIALEVIGTLALKASDGLTRLWPSVLLFSSFAITLAIMAHVSTKLPVSLVYPTWAALGTVGAVAGAKLMFGEELSLQQIIGVGVIILGVTLLNGPSLLTRS